MPKNHGNRRLERRIIVLCEGPTEEHYIDGLKGWVKDTYPDSALKIIPDPVGGGGYADIRDRLRKSPDSNCVAVVVLFDFDRYTQHDEEREVFAVILGLAWRSTKKRVPIVLVVSNRNFEYGLCCHDQKYRNSDEEQFLTKKWKYESLKDCKGDERIWDRPHMGGRSHEVALRALSGRRCVVWNDLDVDFGRIPQQVILSRVTLALITRAPGHRTSQTCLILSVEGQPRRSSVSWRLLFRWKPNAYIWWRGPQQRRSQWNTL